MIYYITVIDEDGNEYIRNTWDNAAKATEELEALRLEDPHSGLTYRIDAIPSNEEIRAANAAIPPDPNKDVAGIKLELNRLYGKHNNTTVYSTDSMREYTENDVFGNQTGAVYNGVTVKLCYVCGALVGSQSKHTEFHNKLLP